jgi:hypothetical protein
LSGAAGLNPNPRQGPVASCPGSEHHFIVGDARSSLLLSDSLTADVPTPFERHFDHGEEKKGDF